MVEQVKSEAAEKILDVVVATLETEGYDAVQLRRITREVQVSTTTVYKLFGTRDGLLLAAVERWMAGHVYSRISAARPDESLHDGLIRILNSVFDPWVRHPRMLDAYYRARTGPGGQRLDIQGFQAVVPVSYDLLRGLDQDYVIDLAMVLVHMSYALVSRCAEGTIEPAGILTALERVITRMTGDNSVQTRAVPQSGYASEADLSWDSTLFSLYGPWIEQAQFAGEPSPWAR